MGLTTVWLADKIQLNPISLSLVILNSDMTLTIVIPDGRGLSNKARHELLSNKSKVMPC